MCPLQLHQKNQQVIIYLENNHLRHDCKYGFWHYRSTEEFLMYVTYVCIPVIERFVETEDAALHIYKASDHI